MSMDSTAFDSLLGLCQHQHRRIVLRVLSEERSVTLDDLTKAILKHTHQIPLGEASADVITAVHVSLYQVHLPKLAEEGLIHYDSERELVEPTEQLEQAEATLSTILGAESPPEAPIKL